MVKTEIVYRDSDGVMQNKEFDSFEAAWPLISKLDRKNAHYEWYELRNGKWVDASAVEVMQDEDISRYLVGQVA